MKKIILLSTLLYMSASIAKKNSVATVNGKNIYQSEVDEVFKQSLLIVTQEKPTKKKALDYLINRIIVIDEAKKSKLNKNPKVIAKMEDVLFNAKVSKDLEGQFKKIKVTDGDVKNYYKKNKEYRTSHILFRVRALLIKKKLLKLLKLLVLLIVN